MWIGTLSQIVLTPIESCIHRANTSKALAILACLDKGLEPLMYENIWHEASTVITEAIVLWFT